MLKRIFTYALGSVVILGLFSPLNSLKAATANFTITGPQTISSSTEIIYTGELTNTDTTSYAIKSCAFNHDSPNDFYPLTVNVIAPAGTSAATSGFLVTSTTLTFPLEKAGVSPTINAGEKLKFDMTLTSEAIEEGANIHFSCELLENADSTDTLATISSNSLAVKNVQPTPPPAPTPAPPVDTKLQTIILPSGFTSKTITDAVLNNKPKVSSLDFSFLGNYEVTFIGDFDLSNTDLRAKLSKIGDYLIFSDSSIEVKSSEFPQLNIPAIIKLPFSGIGLDTLKIYKDGVDVTRTVTDLVFNTKAGIVTFKVTGFSKYEVVDIASTLTPISTPVKQPVVTEVTPSKSMNPVIILIAIIVLAALTAGGYYLYQKKLLKDKTSMKVDTTESLVETDELETTDQTEELDNSEVLEVEETKIPEFTDTNNPKEIPPVEETETDPTRVGL